MCTLVILRRPGHAWPLVLAANRDEMVDRPWQPPGRHWPKRPHVVAGRDRLAGGSWLALGDHGLVAAVLNRRGSLGPAPGKRSRGDLVLEALDHRDADDAADSLAARDFADRRPFNLVVADARTAYWLRHAGEGRPPDLHPLGPGLAMLTAGELDDASSPRIARHRPRFVAAIPPDPDADDWRAWEALLAARAGAGEDPHAGMTVTTPGGYGTVCASLIALPADATRAPMWRFAAGPPDRTTFRRVELVGADRSAD